MEAYIPDRRGWYRFVYLALACIYNHEGDVTQKNRQRNVPAPDPNDSASPQMPQEPTVDTEPSPRKFNTIHTIDKIIPITLGFAYFMCHLLKPPRIGGGRQTAPYRPVTPDCRDPFYLRPFLVYPDQNR